MADAALTVVVPTRDRAVLLEKCIASLRVAAEQVDAAVEIVVADDGSVDATADHLSAQDDLIVVTCDRPLGSSAARNRAVAVASAPLIVFVDDDVVVDGQLLARHFDHHRDQPEPEAALSGLVTWTREAPITRHMEWLERGGPLFAFDTINDPDRVDPRHFCTANVSVKRELLERVVGPFDERLERFTDVELGLRLADAGMRLRHDPLAVAWHLRHDTPATTDDRMRVVGRASVMLDALHPGIAPPAAPRTQWRRLKAGAAVALSPLAPILPARFADRIWEARAAWAYAEGRREAGA